MSMRAEVQRAYVTARREAPTEITHHARTFGTYNPMVNAQGITDTPAYIVGVWHTDQKTLEPVAQGRELSGMASLLVEDVAAMPNEGDLLTVDSTNYNVVKVRDVLGVVYQVFVAGIAPDAEPAADVTAPTLSALVTNTGTTTFTYTATASESAEHRIRYRSPPNTGSFVTGSWSGSFTTSISGTSPTLDSGTYEVDIQARDAAGNASAWYSMPNVLVSGVPA